MSFKEIFQTESLVSCNAHARVNLIGEHTDYTGGFVLPTLLKFKTQLKFLQTVKKNIRYIQNILMKKKSSMILLNLKIMIGLIISKVVYLFFIMNVNMSRVSI